MRPGRYAAVFAVGPGHELTIMVVPVQVEAGIDIMMPSIDVWRP